MAFEHKQRLNLAGLGHSRSSPPDRLAVVPTRLVFGLRSWRTHNVHDRRPATVLRQHPACLLSLCLRGNLYEHGVLTEVPGLG